MESPAPQNTVWQVGERYRGWRLDQFLSEQIPSLSRTRIQGIIPKRIRVSWLPDGVRPQASTRVHVGGDVIAEHPKLNEIQKEFHFEVLYEDENLLAIHKPRGMTVHPTNRQRVNTLIEAIRRERNEPGLTLTHRLDRETSGVLLLAKSSQAARACGKAFMARQLHKTYLAKVHGRPVADSGIVDRPIGKAINSRVIVRRAVVSEGEGESATTHFRIIRSENGFSWLELKPITGRRHQLRVHCEYLGCPIVGDSLYGQPDEIYIELVEGKREAELMHLHAWKLEGRVGQTDVKISAQLPEILEMGEGFYHPPSFLLNVR